MDRETGEKVRLYSGDFKFLRCEEEENYYCYLNVSVELLGLAI